MLIWGFQCTLSQEFVQLKVDLNGPIKPLINTKCFAICCLMFFLYSGPTLLLLFGRLMIDHYTERRERGSVYVCLNMCVCSELAGPTRLVVQGIYQENILQKKVDQDFLMKTSRFSIECLRAIPVCVNVCERNYDSKVLELNFSKISIHPSILF